MARGAVENSSRGHRLGLEMAAPRHGCRGSRASARRREDVRGFAEGVRYVFALFAADRPELLALIEADRLGQLRTGRRERGRRPAPGEARGARTLGLIGTGWQAESQVRCIRAVLPGSSEVVAYSRNAERLADFCERLDCEPGEYNKDAAEQEVVVTITNSRDPVLRGEWLLPGALVCAAGANWSESRELDNAVLERATFVCCDSLEQARLEAGDLVEPVERGVLDWLEVHELAEVVGGETRRPPARRRHRLFKSLGIAAEDVAVAAFVFDRAVERGAGIELS